MARRRPAISFTKTRPPSNASSSGLRFSKGDPGRCRGDRQQRLDCLVSRGKDGRDYRSCRHRTARNRTFGKRCIAKRHFYFFERHACLLRTQAARESCKCRCRCPACRRRRGQCHHRAAARSPRRKSRGDPRSPGHSPAEDQSVAFHRADFGIALRPAKLFRAQLRGTRDNAATKTECLIASSIFGSFKIAKSNGIDLELVGQFVHRRFGRVKAGDGARAAHVGR